MPLYEYLCDKCGSKFELIEKFSDLPKTVHEGCGGGVHRLISAPAFQFKGSGFYITDYAKSGASKADSGKGDSDSGKGDSKKSSDGKSEPSSSPSESKPSNSPPAAPSTSTTSSSSSSSDSAGGSKN